MDESQSMMPPVLTPGSMHDVLAKMVGRWKAQTKAYHDPNSPPFESQGLEEGEWVLGGLGVAYRYESDMGPMKFQGFGFTTWNQMENCYQGYWFDNMSPAGPAGFKGHYDPDTRTMTSNMECMGPSGYIIHQRLVDVWHDEDHRTFEIYRVRPEGEQLSLHIDYTREHQPAAAPRPRAAARKARPAPKKKMAARGRPRPKTKAKAKTKRKTAKRAKRR
ncbi:MAG TPA: DUF1579 family protein [Phycisphaerae bacterium]